VSRQLPRVQFGLLTDAALLVVLSVLEHSL